jgi:uncharacterized protein YjiS (DUF1127 family)
MNIRHLISKRSEMPQVREATGRSGKPTPRICNQKAIGIYGENMTAAMRGAQGGHAAPPVAMRMQHIYLPPQRGKSLRNEPFEKEHAMAATHTTRPAPLGAITTYRFVQLADATLAAFAGWNDARLTRKALGKLSDRELDDIGLCRGDIETIGVQPRI